MAYLWFEEGIGRECGPSPFLAVDAMTDVVIEWVSGDFVLDSATKTRTAFGGHGWYSFLERGGKEKDLVMPGI